MRIYDMDKKCYVEITQINNPTTKVEQLSDAIYCYKSEIFDVIYDKSQPALKAHVESFGNDFLKQDEMQFLYFTSGTTGTPTGVYKTKENSKKQAWACIDTFPKDMKFNRVVTTVPFVHIYGVDIGGVLPFELDIDVWTKENFIPEELAREAAVEGTLVVTTPLFIKALNRIDVDKKFTNTLFLTSTAPLMPDDAKEFHDKYNCSVSQLFASTETGLMGYKFDDETVLRAYKDVEIGESDNMLNISSPFVAKKILNDSVQEVEFPFQTEDIVEMLSEHEFKLLGRSSNLAKVAGKRISTLQIESIVETLDGVECALVKVRKDAKALRDEILDIYVESSVEVKSKDLKVALKEVFGSMHIVFKLYNNMVITKSSVGKKIGFKEKN